MVDNGTSWSVKEGVRAAQLMYYCKHRHWKRFREHAWMRVWRKKETPEYCDQIKHLQALTLWAGHVKLINIKYPLGITMKVDMTTIGCWMSPYVSTGGRIYQPPKQLSGLWRWRKWCNRPDSGATGAKLEVGIIIINVDRKRELIVNMKALFEFTESSIQAVITQQHCGDYRKIGLAHLLPDHSKPC